MAAADARVNPKVSVPKGVATDFKIRPQTAQQPQVQSLINDQQLCCLVYEAVT
jgi:hypothetical protein